MAPYYCSPLIAFVIFSVLACVTPSFQTQRSYATATRAGKGKGDANRKGPQRAKDGGSKSKTGSADKYDWKSSQAGRPGKGTKKGNDAKSKGVADRSGQFDAERKKELSTTSKDYGGRTNMQSGSSGANANKERPNNKNHEEQQQQREPNHDRGAKTSDKGGKRGDPVAQAWKPKEKMHGYPATDRRKEPQGVSSTPIGVNSKNGNPSQPVGRQRDGASGIHERSPPAQTPSFSSATSRPLPPSPAGPVPLPSPNAPTLPRPSRASSPPAGPVHPPFHNAPTLPPAIRVSSPTHACTAASPCHLEHTPPPSVFRVEKLEGLLFAQSLSSSELVADKSVRSVFAAALATTAGVGRDQVHVTSISEGRRLAGFLHSSNGWRRLAGNEVRVAFILEARNRYHADHISTSLAGVAPASIQREIALEMAREGKPYSVQVSSITVSQQSAVLRSHAPVDANSSDSHPGTSAATSIAIVVALTCFFACCVVALWLRIIRRASAIKKISSCEDNVAVSKVVMVKSCALSDADSKSGRQPTTAPHKIQPMPTDDAWSEVSTDVGSNASLSPASSLSSSTCSQMAWPEVPCSRPHESSAHKTHRASKVATTHTSGHQARGGNSVGSSSAIPDMRRSKSIPAVDRRSASERRAAHPAVPSSVRAKSYGRPMLSESPIYKDRPAMASGRRSSSTPPHLGRGGSGTTCGSL